MLVIAHRTCPRHEAENSKAGIRRAAALGADAVELDVRLAAGGVPVLLHDPIPWRTTWLVAPVPVRWLPAAVVTRLPQRRGRERVPSFAAALAALTPLAPLRTAIDIKAADAAPATVEAVRTAGLFDRVLLWSQHARAVEHCVTAVPDVEVSLLRDTFTPSETRAYLDDAVRLGARGVSLHWDAVSATILDDAHARGLTVYSWCQWRDRQAEHRDLPLDGIVTDWPDEARAIYTAEASE